MGDFYKEKHGKELIRDYLLCIGEDPDRPGLLETPSRVVRAWEELYSGYHQDPAEVFKIFEDSEEEGGLVYLKDIEFSSMCEHHMLPFTGVAHIGYIPNGAVIGVSKLARLLEIYTRRLQVQERIAEQVTNALMKYLAPKGAACIIQATHHCISSRGIKKQHASMGYSSMKGVFLTDINTRNEFVTLVMAK